MFYIIITNMATIRKSEEVKQFKYIDSESQVLFQYSSQSFVNIHLQKGKISTR